VFHIFLGVLPQEQMLVFLGTSTFSTITFYAFGQLFRRLIGSIFISPDQKFVRISHLTFFGNRQETVVYLYELKPLCDSNPNMNDIFLKVSPIDKNVEPLKHSLFLSLKYGGIVDLDKFKQIFGTL